jgi:trimethylamine:corrinoid methyltransferase-like protein
MNNRDKEIFSPGPAIERANQQRWQQRGATETNARLHDEVKKLLKSYQPSALPETTKKDLVKLMEKEARRYGQDQLPLRQ